MIPDTQEQPSSRLFNSPLETGLRSAILLLESYPAAYDLQRLVFFDYLLVHSGDAPDGPDSIHPPTPFRSNEIIVRRGLIESGLMLMVNRGLLVRTFGDSGIVYSATNLTPTFVDCLTADYTIALRDKAEWVVSVFGNKSDNELSDFFHRHLDRWGTEFQYQPIIQEHGDE